MSILVFKDEIITGSSCFYGLTAAIFNHFALEVLFEGRQKIFFVFCSLDNLLLFLSHFPGSDWSHCRVRFQDVTVPRHTVLWKPRGLVRISIYYSWFTRELIDMDLITVKILSLSSLLSDLSVWSSRLKWQNIVDLFSETRCWLTLWTNTL